MILNIMFSVESHFILVWWVDGQKVCLYIEIGVEKEYQKVKVVWGRNSFYQRATPKEKTFCAH